MNIYIYIYICIYIYIYIYNIHRRLRGISRRRRPPIGTSCFGSVSCSCRACERAGEAKLCGRVRWECLPTLAPRTVRCICGGGALVSTCGFCAFAAMRIRFSVYFHTDRLLFVWFCWSRCAFDAMGLVV